MTALVQVSVFYPAQLFDIASIDEVIENVLNESAMAAKADLAAVTRSWKHRPQFRIEKAHYARWVHASSGEVGQRFDMLDGGTRKHPITARNVPRLRFFRTGFEAKTVPRQLYSGGGKKANRDFTQPVTVQHPGTEARLWYDEVGLKWDKELPVQMQRAIDAEFTKQENGPIKVVAG